MIWPPQKNIALGLDIQGGTSFLIRLKGGDKEVTKGMLDQAVEVIRKRIDVFGVSEPIISPVGSDRILIRHEACSPGPHAREVGYCLLGEQVGRGNAITDDWSAQARPPPGLDHAWCFDFPLQATLVPVPAPRQSGKGP